MPAAHRPPQRDPMHLVDSHCHIDASEFDPDRSAVLERAAAASVTWIVAPAVSAASWPTLKAVADAHPQVIPAYGLHPMFLDAHQPEHLTQLRKWIDTERPCAIGECGLDHWVGNLDPERQREILFGQLKLAREFDLPVILHARKALDEVMSLLRRIGGLRGVLHSFSGSQQQAEQLYDMGFLLGIGGPVTYTRASRLRGIMRKLPIEYLLLETDAPDQPDSGIRGQRNEPARLLEILRVIAQLRDEPPEQIARHTTANAQRLFQLPVWPNTQP